MNHVPRLLTPPTVLANCCVSNTHVRHGTVPQQCVILSVRPSRSVSYKLKMIVDELKFKSCSVYEGKLGYIVNYAVRCMGSNPSQFLYLLRVLFSKTWRLASCGFLCSCLLHVGFFLGLFFDPEDGGNMVHRNILLTFTGLHGVASQKI
jgi:hypothetical protein